MLTANAPISDICDKVREILRKINDRVPAGALGRAKACPHILAVELACRSLNVMFSKERLMAQTSVSAKDITQALTNCKSLLRLTFAKASAMDILSMQFGAGHRGAALALLADYQRLYVDRLDKARQLLVDLTAPEYQTAAYFLAAKQKKACVDKRKLLEATEVSSQLFLKIVSDLEKVCSQAAAGAGASAGAGAGLGAGEARAGAAGGLASNASAAARVSLGGKRSRQGPHGTEGASGSSSAQPETEIHRAVVAVTKPQAISLNSPPTAAPLVPDKEKENYNNGGGSRPAELAAATTPSSSSASEVPGDELETAARRSIASSALLKRKVDPAAAAQAALGLPALHQQAQERRRQEEEELRLQTEKRKEQERGMYALWKERTLKKRKMEQA